MKGYFQAEVDGKYQFQMSGDDWQWFYMSIPETNGRRARILRENDKDTYYGDEHSTEIHDHNYRESYEGDDDLSGDVETVARYLQDADSTDDTTSDESADTTAEDERWQEWYTSDPANKRLLISRIGASGGFRKVTAYTEWIDMKAGQLYYMEGHLLQGSGALYYSIGVEIDPYDDTPILEPEHP